MTVGTEQAQLQPRWDIGSGAGDIVGMPLLAEASRQFRGALDGVTVLYVNHDISDSLMLARALSRAGADLVNVLVRYRGPSRTPAQVSMRRAFIDLGPTYAPIPHHPLAFATAMRLSVNEALHQFARDRPRRTWMVVEDGGYAFPALHDDPELLPYLQTCLGGVEHTTRGRWNYEYRETDDVPITPRTLLRPAVTISGSRLKTAHEGGFVGQGLLDECHWLLRRDQQFLRHRTVVLNGYGRVGHALARALVDADATVLVHDIAEREITCGTPTHDLVGAIASGAFLVFGATGTSSFPQAALNAFLHASPQPTLYLASASSKALEFGEALALLDQAVTDPATAVRIAGAGGRVHATVDPDVGLRYFITGPAIDKQVVFLGQGYPVIFYPSETHGAPNRAMDPVMTQLFLAAAGLPAAAPTLHNRVHDLDALRELDALPAPWRTLLDEERTLRDWCTVNHIDWPTYRNRVGFATPPIGARA